MWLIDADALIKEACAEGAYGYVDAKQIADAPTVDAVPVVRCKDCIHSYDDLCGLCCTCGPYVDCVVQPDFYCADGRRGECSAWSGIKSSRPSTGKVH